MAKAIIVVFPCLKKAAEGCEGHVSTLSCN